MGRADGRRGLEGMAAGILAEQGAPVCLADGVEVDSLRRGRQKFNRVVEQRLGRTQLSGRLRHAEVEARPIALGRG